MAKIIKFDPYRKERRNEFRTNWFIKLLVKSISLNDDKRSFALTILDAMTAFNRMISFIFGYFVPCLFVISVVGKLNTKWAHNYTTNMLIALGLVLAGAAMLGTIDKIDSIFNPSPSSRLYRAVRNSGALMRPFFTGEYDQTNCILVIILARAFSIVTLAFTFIFPQDSSMIMFYIVGFFMGMIQSEMSDRAEMITCASLFERIHGYKLPRDERVYMYCETIDYRTIDGKYID